MGDWNESSRRRRDFRAVKDSPEVAKAQSKKNTRRWCRGRAGREHKPLWVRNDAHASWMQKICETCGKHLDSCWPWGRQPCKCGFHQK